MRENYSKNEKIFYLINIVLFIVSFTLYGLKDVSGLVLLFFFIFLVNAVCSLSLYKTFKEVDKRFMNLAKMVLSVVFNLLTYMYLILFVVSIF